MDISIGGRKAERVTFELVSIFIFYINLIDNFYLERTTFDFYVVQ